jgi:hypothetical protein
MVMVSAPSPLDATAIPSSSAASKVPGQSGHGAFQQIYEETESETAPAAQAPSRRDAGSAKTSSAKADSAQTGSATPGDVRTEAVKTSVAKTNAAKTNAARTDSAKTDVAKTGAIEPEAIETGAVETGDTKIAAKAGAAKRTPAEAKGKDASRNDNDAAAVAQTPDSQSPAKAPLTLSLSLAPDGDSSAEDQHDAGQNKGQDPKPRTMPSALLTPLPSLLEVAPGLDRAHGDTGLERAADTHQADSRVTLSSDRPAPDASLTPRLEPVAFSMRLRNNEALPVQTGAAARSSQTVTPDQDTSQHAIKPAGAPAAAGHSGGKSADDDESNAAPSQVAPDTSPALAATREIVVEAPAGDAPAPAAARETVAVATPRPVEPATPETASANSSSGILLRLSGPDQSSASVRVMDRGGALNIQVHASDPDLRSSLRSNLGDLASQLNAQGWKTDAAKPAIATHSDNNAGARQNGQRSFQQREQTPQGDRQPQRDRHSGTDRWIDEFEPETSSPAVKSGGRL